jgi:dipeptidyl aminopeptidase/acylaminoacyl peptidase
MMPNDRFDRRLPAILEEISQPRRPDYFDDLVGLSARTRQRPAWTLLERWLPVVDITRQPAFARQVPWRPIAALALILLLVLVSLAWVVGSRHPVPAPFGPARNGLVAFAKDGDIYTADAVTGASTAIVKGPANDVNPKWSHDGTLVAFQRMAQGSSNVGQVYVGRPDGSDLVPVTSGPLVNVTGYDFSPDGKRLLIAADQGGVPGLFIAATDGSESHPLDLRKRVTDAAWRPPDGSEILFMDAGTDSSGTDSSIYAVNAVSGQVRTILRGADAAGRYRGHPLWSPDGSEIAYGEWCDYDCSTGQALPADAGTTVRAHIIRADGTGDRLLPSPTITEFQAPESWSNDGTRMLVVRGEFTSSSGQPVAIPVDGSGPGVEIPYPGGMSPTDTADWTWAPDDSAILGAPSDPSGTILDQVMLDPVNGTIRTPSWASVSQATWQRLAH